jgi:SagB-type dehydrogenase family enzyme
LLFFSAAISATKVVPSTGYRYALRVHPSSGNLHPSEFHFITRGLQDWPDGLYHYRPSSHMAEQRATGDFSAALDIAAPVVFVLTSIAWREAWKYQDRAYRYCLLDIGHAWESLALSARAAGCELSATGHFADDSIAALCDLNADEWPMLVATLSGGAIPMREPDRKPLSRISGKANALSKKYVTYESIDAVHQSTKLPDGTRTGPMRTTEPVTGLPLESLPFGEVARQRRSALDFIGGNKSIASEQLLAILSASAPRAIDLYVYVHRVTGFQPGLYRYKTAPAELELIRMGDQRVIAAGLSLQQELAGNACFAISMIANLQQICARHGPRGYRYAHFEAGAVGQRLYLAAEALGLRATGMGAFFDDEVDRYLQLTPDEGEVVYHFAIGYPIPDPRIEALA